MDRSRIIVNKIILMTILITIILSAVAVMPVEAQKFLTEEELDYISKSNIIEAASIHGAAPIQYSGTNGQVKGISKEILKEISRITNLTFKYSLYDTLDEVLNSGADIVFGMPAQYSTEEIFLSQPYLRTETIFYVNSSVDPEELDDKLYAAVRGSELPEGIKEDNSIYFDTREESMNAVENGKADYGFGNAYSVSFYTIQNNYKNIITVPQSKESRAYSIGILKGDKILLSIINKSIDSIDETRLSTLVLHSASQIERKITFDMIMDLYGLQIFVASLIIILVLSASVIYNLKTKMELRYQYERYQILSQIDQLTGLYNPSTTKELITSG